MYRRDLLRYAAVAGLGAVAGSSPWRPALATIPATTGPGPYGPLLAADPNGIMLPAGFSSRVLARAGQPTGPSAYVWPWFPDGGATFDVRGGWVYVANTEWLAPQGGGVSALRFDRKGTLLAAYPILTGTVINCAGGSTPWKTWLTCEEVASGHVWECDPLGIEPGVQRPALGTFKHEAVAVDPRRRRLYLTEDESDGRFYRFTPTRWRELGDGGLLEVAAVGGDGSVAWLPVPNPNPTLPAQTPTRQQVPASTAFKGGEGIIYARDHVYFTTKGDNRVWDLDVRRNRITVLYENALDPGQQLSGVDNITVARSRDLLVAEDGGNMELVLISPGGIVSPLLRVVGQDGSELTGPAFAPSGKHLYFSSQRGDGLGITYEVTGPFRRRARD